MDIQSTSNPLFAILLIPWAILRAACRFVRRLRANAPGMIGFIGLVAYFIFTLPDPEKTRSKQHILLRSQDIPRLTELPPGCSFHPRCPWHVDKVCNREVPELSIPLQSDTDVEVACIPLQQGKELELHGA